MKCAFCGNEYNAEEAVSACQACPVAKGCCLMKCPRCGYESPAEPGWLKNLFKRRDNDSQK